MKRTHLARHDFLVVGTAALLALPISAQVTQLVSVSGGGAQGNSNSFDSVISADGRYVVFESYAHNLVAGDTNGYADVFVRDRLTATTERVSVDSGGVGGNHPSGRGRISSDGRYVVFESDSTNLVLGDTNGVSDIFVRDRQSGTTERVSVDSAGTQANSDSFYPWISADGRYVVFVSNATNLVLGDTNGWVDVFVRDRQNGTTERVSVDSGGAQANGFSEFPTISADGRYVVFQSWASNLAPGDTNAHRDVFLRDRQNGTTERVSVDSAGVEGNGDSILPSISADGRHVAFTSFATNIVVGDTNAYNDVFVRDRQAGTTERVSVDSSGAQGNNASNCASISGDGRFVAFQSHASNLVPADTNTALDVFVRDRQNGTTQRVSLDSSGMQGNYPSDNPAISADGRYVVFQSDATNLVEGDTNLFTDIFIRDRDATGFISLCDPGIGGVIACPCSNPPSGSARGCDNSAATGGASLSASGIAYLSLDSLVFTTNGEKPTATSVVLQGTASHPAGMVYGQGVRCVGGALKRLFVRMAVGGSITAPDFGAGDPAVSVRSAAKGDVIQPGQSRWYLVYYRDPVVLGSCPASSTFNATQTGRVDWSF